MADIMTTPSRFDENKQKIQGQSVRKTVCLGYGVGSEQAGAGYGGANNVLSIRGCVCVTVGGKARKRSLRCEKINGNHYALMEVISTLV